MNFDATIRQLEERRDFYAAAIAALRKLEATENGTPKTRTSSDGNGLGSGNRTARTPEQRARASAAKREWWARQRAATPTQTPEPELVTQ